MFDLIQKICRIWLKEWKDIIERKFFIDFENKQQSLKTNFSLLQRQKQDLCKFHITMDLKVKRKLKCAEVKWD